VGKKSEGEHAAGERSTKKAVNYYHIDLVKLNDGKRAGRMTVIIAVVYATLLICLMVAIMIGYSYLVATNECTFQQKIAEGMKSGASIVAVLITLLFSWGAEQFNKKYAISQKIIQKYIDYRYNALRKTYGVGDVSDETFVLANEIVEKISNMQRTPRLLKWEIGSKNPSFRVDYFELIYCIYVQLNKLEYTKTKSNKSNSIILYDFSLSTASDDCQELLSKYKKAEQLTNILIVSNRNYLPQAERLRWLSNVNENGQLILAQNVFEITNSLSSHLASSLREIGLPFDRRWYEKQEYRG
jgi:hypothetical protein